MSWRPLHVADHAPGYGLCKRHADETASATPVGRQRPVDALADERQSVGAREL